SYCPRTIALQSGRIVYDGPSEALTPALLSSIYGAESSEFVMPAFAQPSLASSRRQRESTPARAALRVTQLGSANQLSAYPNAGSAVPHRRRSHHQRRPHTMMRAVLTCAAAAVAIGASALAAGAQTPTEINFGVISTEASVNQKKNWEPFLQAMSKATGFKVNGFYATDYAGVIEAMRFNKIQVAWFGNKSGME